MLTLYAPQAQMLWDPLLPIGVGGELRADLREIDALLADLALVAAIAAHWQREAETRGYSAAGVGRATIAMQTYVRLMVLRKRVAGEPIADRVVSLSDTDARPIRKGKRGKPTELGYVSQIAEVTASTKPGQRGFVMVPATAPGNPHENELLPATVAEFEAVAMSPHEVSLDGGFGHRKTDEQLAPIAPERTFIAGRPSDRSKRTQRRLARYRVGAEGRISHLKRRYGLDRSRLKGSEGHQTWTGWAALAYNLDTYTALG